MNKPSPRVRLAAAFALGSVLSGCLDPDVSRAPQSPAVDTLDPLIETTIAGLNEDQCSSSVATPAVFETVTELVVVQPEILDGDGVVKSLEIVRYEEQQRILRDPGEVEFKVPCPDVQTPEFTASVQRALSARGYYDGPITGEVNPALTAAILRYQTAEGDIQTGQLTIRTARNLGLVAQRRDDL